MANEFEDVYQSVPLRTVFVSFLLAMLLDFMPFPFDVFFWLPQLTALTLLYWTIHAQKHIGLGTAFAIGLLVDVGTAASLGIHALSYTVMVFFVLRQQRQIMLYGHVMQLLAVLAALVCNQAVLVVARLFLNHQIITWQSFVAPFVGALLWPLFSQLILYATRVSRASQTGRFE